ncbi:methyltransferase domain-containing protein [Candidatus Woesearchaeota archaeon]|nr:methyltransferase domain-containing protein [Candidatus Woesearchaeota archaeon]
MEKLLNKNVSLQIKPWRPDKPVSKGATAYHDAVSNASYYLESFDKLLRIVSQKIKDGDIVVDFGAGTGVSALQLMKRLKANIKVWLVDNSPAWLGKAYEIFRKNPNVECFLLEKTNDTYATLGETIGENTVDHVISANTVHLIQDLEYTFKGINSALKPNGTFTFQSGNIIRNNRKHGILMVDDTVKRIHDIAIEIVQTDKNYTNYKKIIDKRIETESRQRQIVFPEPRPLEYYLEMLKAAYFKYTEPYCKLLKIKYNEWMNFLRVKRLQAGILPEIGGINPSPEEENDRDNLITMSANRLFEELKNKNPMSDEESFTVELIYVTAYKPML